MDVEERMNLITRNTEEILTPEDLKSLLETGTPLKHYIGFEISGMIHLGTGIMSMTKVRDFQQAGVDCSVFLADWHSWINDKLGGDLETIKRVAGGYFKEGMKACLKAVGGDPDKIRFVLGSDLYHNNDEYWRTVIDISKNTTLGRMQRSITILGRKEGEAVDFAKLIYPAMQVADIFVQGVNLAHSGADQRKAHVIARDVGLKLRFSVLRNAKGERIKPVAVHHPLILGLGKPPVWPVSQDNLKEVLSAMKMSKSKPDTAVFVHDAPEEIERKVNKAFCLAGETGFNPVLDWAEKILFAREGFVLEVERPEKFGGNVSFQSFQELEQAFARKELHPADLKSAVAREVARMLEPVRKHFEKPGPRRMLEELKELKVTR